MKLLLPEDTDILSVVPPELKNDPEYFPRHRKATHFVVRKGPGDTQLGVLREKRDHAWMGMDQFSTLWSLMAPGVELCRPLGEGIDEWALVRSSAGQLMRFTGRGRFEWNDELKRRSPRKDMNSSPTFQ